MKKKPFSTYPGGKGADGTYQTIINQIPPHEIYIEGFLGGGAIMSHKKPAPTANFGIDIDESVISSWSEFGQFSFFFYQDDFTSWISENISDLLTKGKGIFIFIDPPYLKSVRKSNRKIYAHEMMDESEHEHLLRLITSLSDQFPSRILFCISHYKNELYNRILAGWRTLEFKSKTRKGSVVETLYMNYPEPKKLHDYQYLGRDYRERNRIKERVKRNVERLIKMDSLERNAIIQAIKTNEELK